MADRTEITGKPDNSTDSIQTVFDRIGQIRVGRRGLLAGAGLASLGLAGYACGGGSKPGTGEVGGVGNAPGSGVSPRTGATETGQAASPTKVPEAPTATATTEAQLTQDQLKDIASQVKDSILNNPSYGKVTSGEINKAGGEDRYLDPNYLTKAIANCNMDNYGKTFYAVNLDQDVDPSAPNYASVFLINCAQPAAVSKALFDATGDPGFRQANQDWKQVHRAIFDAVHATDHKDWTPVEQRYYIPQ